MIRFTKLDAAGEMEDGAAKEMGIGWRGSKVGGGGGSSSRPRRVRGRTGRAAWLDRARRWVRACRSESRGPEGMGPVTGPGHRAGLQGLLTGRPRLERRLRPGGEPQVSGESPLAVTGVPSLPCPVACPSGPGCVHRVAPFDPMYTTGRARMSRAAGIYPAFSPARSRRCLVAAGRSTAAPAARPFRAARIVLYRDIAFAERIGQDRAENSGKIGRFHAGSRPAPGPGGDWRTRGAAVRLGTWNIPGPRVRAWQGILPVIRRGRILPDILRCHVRGQARTESAPSAAGRPCRRDHVEPQQVRHDDEST